MTSSTIDTAGACTGTGASMEDAPDSPAVSRSDSRPWFPLMGARAAAVVTGADTAGAWEVMELTVMPGGRSPLHTVPREKLFYVTAGRLTVVTGERHDELGTRDSVLVPAGTPHCYRNDSTEPATVLVMATGTGHVDFLAGMSRLTAAGAPDPEALREHTARFGVRIIPAQPR